MGRRSRRMKLVEIFPKLVLIVSLAAVQWACRSSSDVQQTPAPAPMLSDGSANIVATLSADGRFSDFLDALAEAGMTDPLSNDGPFSVFVPLSGGGAQPYAVSDHVSAGTLTANDLNNIDGSLVMLSGKAVPVAGHGELMLGNGTRVIQTDVPAANGLIHLIDGPLVTE